jgi:hypothetical protein
MLDAHQSKKWRDIKETRYFSRLTVFTNTNMIMTMSRECAPANQFARHTRSLTVKLDSRRTGWLRKVNVRLASIAAERAWTRENCKRLTTAVLSAAFAKRVRTTRRSRSFASRCCRRYNADIGDYPTTTLLTAICRYETLYSAGCHDTWEIYPASHDVRWTKEEVRSSKLLSLTVLEESLRAGFNACLAKVKQPLGTTATSNARWMPSHLCTLVD